MSHMSKSYFAMLLFAGVVILGFLSGGTEHFMQKDAGMPLDGPAMGPYDSVMGGWMSSEHMPVGSLPQNKSLEENKLMYLVGNEVSSKCGPGTFSTDTGYVCLTQNDRNVMAHRGGNK
jgi:hypothetical protein